MIAPRVFASLLVAAVVAQAPADPAERRRPPLGLDLYMPVPEENPLTPEKIALGQRLFSERLLSRDRTLACVNCHDPQRAFTDSRPVAIGLRGQVGTRSAPTLVNRGYGRSQFWDGRAPSLEAQVLEPIVNPKELDLTIEEAVQRLARTPEYGDGFQAAFGRAVNAQDLARALASYVRTILSGNSPLDRYMDGDQEALSGQARQGLGIFRGKGNCTTCHVGPTLTDEQFHNTGVAWKRLRPLPSADARGSSERGSGPASAEESGGLVDLGRFVITGKDADRGAFKTPTLREIARTAPYMHDGTFSTLEEVVDFYNRGGNKNPFLDAELRPLGLNDNEKQALLVFLRASPATSTKGLMRSST